MAIYLVLTLHMVGRTGFYDHDTVGFYMFLATYIRMLSRSCVALFIMLTGYLTCSKNYLTPANKKHYFLKLFNVLCIYLFAGIICKSLSVLKSILTYENLSVRKLIFSFLDFTAAPYAWYVEMYIGLFLLTPLLNILWQNTDEMMRKYLLIVLLVLTSVPSIFNSFDFNKADFWIATVEEHTQIVPDWWQGIWPLTYWFLGAFISTKRAKIIECKKMVVVVVFCIISVFLCLMNYVRYYGTCFSWGIDTDNYSMQNLIISIGMFCICLCIFNKNRNNRMVNLIAKYSLGIYLVSYIGDTIFYEYVMPKTWGGTALLYGLLITPVNLGISLIISKVITDMVNKTTSMIEKLLVQK